MNTGIPIAQTIVNPPRRKTRKRHTYGVGKVLSKSQERINLEGVIETLANAKMDLETVTGLLKTAKLRGHKTLLQKKSLYTENISKTQYNQIRGVKT